MKALPQVSRDLLEAARIVERGWCQHVYAMDEDGLGVSVEYGDRFCMLGAIRKVVGEDVESTCFQTDCIVAVEKHLGINCIYDWNDAPERTQAEVVKALQDAALKAAEGHGG